MSPRVSPPSCRSSRSVPFRARSRPRRCRCSAFPRGHGSPASSSKSASTRSTSPIRFRRCASTSPSTRFAASSGGSPSTSRRLARMVTGRVHLVFFNTTPTYIEATGKTLAELEQLTRMMVANGGTSIGVGLRALMERPGGTDLDGIAVVSDAKENNPPPFPIVYHQYCEATGKTPAVYLYRMQASGIGPGDVDLADGMLRYQFEMTEFDLRGGFDYTSLPNLVQTMRAGRYSLVEEVMETPLLTVEQALKARDRRAS